jgi:hypothetical protein
MAFGKCKTEEYLVPEPNVDREEAADDASPLLARATSSSWTFRDNQEGEGGIDEYRFSVAGETVRDSVKVDGSTKS